MTRGASTSVATLRGTSPHRRSLAESAAQDSVKVLDGTGGQAVGELAIHEPLNVLRAQSCQLRPTEFRREVQPNKLRVASVRSGPDASLNGVLKPSLEELRDGLPFRRYRHTKPLRPKCRGKFLLDLASRLPV